MATLDDVDIAPLREVAECAVVGTSSDGTRRVRAVGTANVDSRFRIASLSKPVTAVAAVLAAQHTGAGVDVPMLEVLPGSARDWVADRQLTIVDVLSQTSGLASLVTGEDIARLGSGDDVFIEGARLVVAAGSARPRGRVWEYYNGNYFVAGALIQALTGTPFEQAVENLVLRPWSLTATSFTPPPSLKPGIDQGVRLPVTDYPRGRRPSGGLCSTADDLLAFGEHLLARPDLLTQVRTVRTHADDPMRYGLGWAIGPSGQMYLNGRLPGYRTALMLVPDHDLVGVALAADSGALTAEGRVLSDLQHDLTGDDIAEAIDAFAA